QPERILIVESKRNQSLRWQRELRSSGYLTVPASSLTRALRLLSGEPVTLMIVLGEAPGRSAGHRSSPHAEAPEAAAESCDSDPAGPDHTSPSGPPGPPPADPFQLCAALKSDLRGRTIPLLLITSTCEEDSLARGLESGADYFLFAPFQLPELLQSVRTALLNGAMEEPSVAEPGIEVFQQDRAYTLTAGPARLARALLSVFADLLHTKSSLSWTQAELRALRKQLPRARDHAEHDALLNEMVQGIAHDFANLMETVSTATAVVSSRSPQLAPYQSDLDVALAQAEALISMVLNFGLFGKEQLLLEPVDPAAVVQEVVQAALLPLRAPKVRVQVHVDGLPPMRTHATLLARCLNNLIWNAVQAMPSGGVLALNGSVDEDRVVLEVSDTGSGIAKDAEDKIFATRYSTKTGHRGMGLSLVRSLVRRSGGDIMLVHRLGRSTTFALAFPVADREALPSRPAILGKRAMPAR
ncbi:MAG: ATP-binding protein, partial [Terriglobia bacterium]